MPPPSRLHYVAEESAYLAVTTKSAVYLYERKSESKRSWTEIREFYTPQAATGLDMVHFAADAVSDLYVGAHATQSHSRKPSSSLPSDSLAQHPTLSLFVRMKEKAVIIRLADSSVRELRLSERDQAQSHLGASMPTTGARSRKASFGRSNSRSSFLGRRGSFSGDHLREAIQATLKLGKSDDSWTSCERVDLGAKQLYLLVTKGHSTYMVPEPIASSSSTADITQSTSIQLLSVYTWRWRSSPSALHATATSLSSSSAVTTAKICLTAVTATGIEVHEGQANLSLLSTGGNVLWTPVVQAEAELEGYTSYDFGAVTKPLAPLQLPRFEADDQSTESNGGAGVVIAVQSVGEWRLKFVG